MKQKEREKKEKRFAAIWKKDRKTLKNGGYSVAVSVAVIAVVILLNMVVSQIPSKYTQFDISTGKLYTIGDETMKVLNGLKEDITIYYIVQKGNEDSTMDKLLEQYEENSKHIHVVKKDPVVYPNFTAKYSEDSISENSLIVEFGERNKVVRYSSLYETTVDYSTYQQSVTGFDGEGQVTGAIAYVISDSLPVLYYLEGHNEVGIPSALRSRMEKANFELKSLSLLTADGIPEDAAGILLNSPETDYSEAEVEKITDYLKNGGRAMVITDYLGKEMKNFQGILAAYGVTVTDGVVVESDKNHYVQMPYYLVPNIGSSVVTNGMTGGSQYVLVSGCQGFTVSEDARESLTITQLLTTTDGSYVKLNPGEMKTYEKEDGDVDGPFFVAAAVEEDTAAAAADAEEEGETGESDAATEEGGVTRLICFASSSILDEGLNDTVSDGNYTLYTNALKWLADSEDTESVSVAVKSVEVQPLAVTAAKGAFFTVLLCFLLPIGCLVAGGAVCLYRKRR